MTKERKIAIWLVWLIIWPGSLIYLYEMLSPSFAGHFIDILSFAILMCIVAYFPIIVDDTPIFFIQGISLAVFLYYGLFVEILLTQIAALFLILNLRIGKSELHRIPVNLLMFLLTSLVGAGIYYLLGGRHGVIPLNDLGAFIPILGYVFGIFAANQIFLHLFRNMITNQKHKFFNVGLLWELWTTLIILPVGFVLYLLYIEMGIQAIYFVGIPFIAVSFILKSFYTSRRMNKYMKRTSDIGQKLTGNLDVKEVLDILVNEIRDLLNVHYTYIWDILNTKQTMTLIRFADQESQQKPPEFILKKGQGISGMVYENGKELIFGRRKEWETIPDPTIPDDVESILSVPVVRNDKTVGVITLASKKRGAFEKYHLMLTKIVANYLAVAIENARHYQTTKSKTETCHLTNLYNYRFIQNYLQQLFEDMEAKGIQESISLILLDLDHFKRINDTYGHESGNEVLCQLANRLKEFIGGQGIVARYGGEEFVILLPGTQKEHAFHLAERLRMRIAEDPFILREHIQVENEPIEIYITASIGVASYPLDCEDPNELIRHADRAMYMGAKQKGRNKVAVYKSAAD
ncbi:MAG: diguanylate cyclase [Bacillaceae bacterium]|nr:diguanylate cyclase [Bacillaceae bacterium]